MRLIIFGEIILDKYYNTTTTRNAPEANIPVYLVNNIEYKLGGATNVALNLSSLCEVEFISAVGDNIYLNEIESLLINNNIKYTFFKENRDNIIKNRIICKNSIVNRYDIESTHDICKNTQDEIFKYIKSKINYIDGFIISDYNKGIIPTELCIKIIELCNQHNIKTFIDPKVNDTTKYENCTFFKPNFKEALEMLDNKNENENEILLNLYKKINCQYLLITNGENGMIGYNNNNNNYIKIKHNDKIDVVDVTGAGDSVIAVFTYIFLLTNDFNFSVKISNYIAGKSVQQIGNFKFNINHIREYNKIIKSNEIDLIRNISKINKNIVFTNGCFDIVHIGHLKLINFAKKQGDTLILGLNSDSSIKKLKGESRPINNLNDRIEFLLLLNIIDYIIIFDEETPLNIIKNLQPSILIKGGDYKIENVVGREYSKKVILYDLILDKSTSNIIDKIKN